MMRGDTPATAQTPSNSRKKRSGLQRSPRWATWSGGGIGVRQGHRNNFSSSPQGSPVEGSTSPTVFGAVPRQSALSIDKGSGCGSPAVWTGSSSLAASTRDTRITDSRAIFQPPPRQSCWAAKPESARDTVGATGVSWRASSSHSGGNTAGIVTKTTKLSSENAESIPKAKGDVNHERSDLSLSPAGCRLELHFASPLSRRHDFTHVVDPHAETMQRLEEEHRCSFRRALYRLQRMHPDPWWRLQSAAYYDVGMPDVLACDESLVSSRVAGKVCDGGVMWLSLKDAAS